MGHMIHAQPQKMIHHHSTSLASSRFLPSQEPPSENNLNRLTTDAICNKSQLHQQQTTNSNLQQASNNKNEHLANKVSNPARNPPAKQNVVLLQVLTNIFGVCYLISWPAAIVALVFPAAVALLLMSLYQSRFFAESEHTFLKHLIYNTIASQYHSDDLALQAT